MKISFPDKVKPIFRHYDYKVLRGGRGSGKSWSIARALLIEGLKRPLRVLCAREVQQSIRDSVYRLLSDQIKMLEFQSGYNVLDSEIRGRNGSLFTFTGLSSLTVDTIKSFEGYDVCWVEEGQSISDRSWRILLPTIRKPGSEIWISYNPDLESDPTHQRFTINPPKNCINIELNWRDNPYFFDTNLNDKRLDCKRDYPEDYANVWEGVCRPAVEGAIYYKQVQEAENQDRICNVDYDPMLKVHLVFDLGYADHMSIGFVQKHLSEIRFIDHISDNRKTIFDYDKELREKPYRFGKVYLPHDGFAKGYNTGESTADILTRLGWDVEMKEVILDKSLSVEEGIRSTRNKFSRFYFDKEKCVNLIESMKRYKRKINRATGGEGTPVHDDSSHDADMVRYVACNESLMVNEPVKPRSESVLREHLRAAAGWMGL